MTGTEIASSNEGAGSRVLPRHPVILSGLDLPATEGNLPTKAKNQGSSKNYLAKIVPQKQGSVLYHTTELAAGRKHDKRLILSALLS